MLYVNSGNGKVPLISLIALLSISLAVNLPGLAISPIMGKLKDVFSNVTQLEIQLINVLPNLLTIPFILLSGKICTQRNQMWILAIGLVIFALTGVIYLFADTMIELIVLSCLIGVGCGLIIPLATSLISQNFFGKARARELGMNSSISNFTVIIATIFVGWVAQVNWHYSFFVYWIPLIPLCLIPFMTNRYLAKHTITVDPGSAPKPSQPEPDTEGFVPYPGKSAAKMMVCLMVLYFLMTYGIEVVSYYLPFAMKHYDLSTVDVGVATSMFFLGASVSGFLLTRIITVFRRFSIQIAILLCVIGLFMIPVFPKDYWAYITGVLLMGLGYGVVQPVLYDKTSFVAPTKEKSTAFFSYLLICNYIGISCVPFIISGAKHLCGLDAMHDVTFSFLFNGCIMTLIFLVAIFKYRSFVFEADPRYYSTLKPPIPGLPSQANPAAPAQNNTETTPAVQSPSTAGASPQENS